MLSNKYCVEIHDNKPQTSRTKTTKACNISLKKGVFPIDTNNVQKYYFENELSSNSFVKKAITPAAGWGLPIRIESNHNDLMKLDHNFNIIHSPEINSTKSGI